MKSERAEEVIDRIVAARGRDGGERGVIAFDGDGTLWSGDIGEDFFRDALAHADFRPPAVARLREEARVHRIALDVRGAGEARGRERGDAADAGLALATAIFDAYFAERYPEDRMCALMAWCFAGWSRAEVRAFAAASLTKGRVQDRFHPEAHQVLRWARDAGIEVFLVSASPRAIIEAAGEVLGLDPHHVVAATPLYASSAADAPMLAELEEPIPYGPGKVRNLEAKVGGRPLLAAFGDNVFDLAMLSEARVPAAVRPKPRLLARAAELPRLVTLAFEPASS